LSTTGPRHLPGQADQTGSAPGGHENLGPADRSFGRTTRAASADSEVRPGPRPPTLTPHQGKARRQGRKHYPHPPAESGSHVQLVIQYQRGCQIDQLCAPLSVLSRRRGRRVIWSPRPEAAFHGRYRPSQVGRRRLLCGAGTARSSWLGGVTDARRRVEDGPGAWSSAHGSGPRSGSSPPPGQCRSP
jgi:hypothetical protein